MMYVHYCKACNRLFMLNGHKMICPRCMEPLTELQLPYMDYVMLNLEEREVLTNTCASEEQLKALSTTYRMYKYSKWYRELQASNEAGESITKLLAEQAVEEKNKRMHH